MSILRLYNGLPIDLLTAHLAAILHHLIAGPVTFETFRDLSVLALNLKIAIDAGGQCEGQEIETEDLIAAIDAAGDIYDDEIANCDRTPSSKKLVSRIYSQLVKAKDEKAIQMMIKAKNLTCKHCHTWHSLPAMGQKCSCIFKQCGFRMEVYEDSPACVKIDPVEEIVP